MKVLIFGGDSDMARPIADLFEDAYLLPKKSCDVRDYEAVKRIVENYNPDVVVDLAGVSRVQFIRESDVKHLHDEMAVNYFGSYHVAKAGTECGVKTLIFIGSVAGKYGKPQHAGYSASKAAVISLVQSLGMEGYDAYCISPGRVDTKMRQHDYPNDQPGTRLETKEIAGVVEDILDKKYKPGSNIIIRRIGTRTQPTWVDDGTPWKQYLNVTPIYDNAG